MEVTFYGLQCPLHAATSGVTLVVDSSSYLTTRRLAILNYLLVFQTVESRTPSGPEMVSSNVWTAEAGSGVWPNRNATVDTTLVDISSQVPYSQHSSGDGTGNGYSVRTVHIPLPMRPRVDISSHAP